VDHLANPATGRSAVAAAAELRNRTAALLTAFLLVVAALVTGVVAAPPAAAAARHVEDTFTDRINQARASHGLRELDSRPHLVAVARRWAERMAEQSKLYHNPSLTSDVNNWRWVGENVGYGPDAPAVHVAFMRSPGHRANILDRDYTEVGVGAVVRGGRVWVAEVFRQPLRVRTASRRSFTAEYRHVLRHGSTGPAVRRVQARLGVRETGFYNRHTKHAVSRFQRSLGWQGRGNVGRHTWRRLF
jgi:uncharacterized protein YkwD